jgi:hypothetical protein
MSVTEKRTPAKPGRSASQQWPADLTVEYGPVRLGATDHGFTAKTYDVYADGARIGEVTNCRVPTTRPITKGSRIVTTTGHHQVWREQSSIPRTGGRWRLAPASTRAEATARLVRRLLGEDV